MSLSLSAFTWLILCLTTFKLCSATTNIEASCPLNFAALRELYVVHLRPAPIMASNCRYVTEGILILRSEYLRTTGYFLPPPGTFQACWNSYRSLIKELLYGYDVEMSCGYRPELIWESCLSITTRSEFESRFSKSALRNTRRYCSGSSIDADSFVSCANKWMGVAKMFRNAPVMEGFSGCSAYIRMYAAAFLNQLGPTDPATAKNLFRLDYPTRSVAVEQQKPLFHGVLFGCIIGISGASAAIVLLWMLHKNWKKKKVDSVERETSVELGLAFHSRGSNLVKFEIEEIRRATMNFSSDNIIGKGNFGNIYKGLLPDGSEVAFKRFKNCSAAGDPTFAHEVEVIASVKHVNLLALRGYCTARVCMEGDQRIIVCDLMRNGSLYDHLFGLGTQKLSWPIRQKIALGTARGLVYLHSGVHPAIIHRDIKASNILLDETFEPKVADFGLARFNSHEGTHLSTRAAGTLGHVAPEYALYGQLTDKSDVYSFGVVLLELLSGKKAYEENGGKVSLLTDWAWSLVKQGRALDVIDEDMPELGVPETMEQFVHIAVICAHPLLHARPSIEQIVNLLETNHSFPSTSRCIFLRI